MLLMHIVRFDGRCVFGFGENFDFNELLASKKKEGKKTRASSLQKLSAKNHRFRRRITASFFFRHLIMTSFDFYVYFYAYR